MNVANINRLIAAVQALETHIDYVSWEQCLTGIAWGLEGKPTEFASSFRLDEWLDIDQKRAGAIEYLWGLDEDDEDNIGIFNRRTLEEQKETLVRGLEGLRDTGKVIWK